MKAPDFILFDQNQNEFKLSDYKNKKILLSFHPLAWTSVCTKQMQTLEKNWSDFIDLNTFVVGVSIDSIPSKKSWADVLKLKNIRLLSDFWPHGEVAKQYGIFREKEGISDRANIIINENREIEFVRVYEISELPDINELLTFLRNLE
jgi:peroxiredoxin